MRSSKALVGLVAGVLAAAVGAAATTARSADQQDSPAVIARPTADLGDLYAWMDAGRLVLAMTVTPSAPAGAQFDGHTQYVIHTASASAFGGVPATGGVDVIATFDDSTPQNLSLWVGRTELVTGIGSVTSGLLSADGKVQVFAGLRSDPFFFNLAGFQRAVGTLGALDASGCPALGASEQQKLLGELSSSADGGAPSNAYAAANTLALVVSLDPSLVTGGGHLVSVWGATYVVPVSDAGGL